MVFVSFKCPVFRKLNKSNFSHNLIKEYQNEMYSTYGVLVSATDAQAQLRGLVRSMFPTVIAEQTTESRELVQGQASLRCRLAPARFQLHLEADGEKRSRGSITPTSGQRDRV